MIVLDTNVLSELIRPAADPAVVAWTDGIESAELLITAISAAEMRAGVRILPPGRRKTRIQDEVEHLIGETFAGYVLAFDVDTSPFYADILARRRRAGSPIAGLDAQIAAICRQHDADLATRNSKDFAATGVALIDPWQADPQS
jgi:predicted nucleic acid-binding protein